ncbi:MAG: hypothetical protein M5T52_24920 [Ignavibacteriaceae bacterium]|nr:hypothetical protein [Ignavibacteriaceae bacterium]
MLVLYTDILKSTDSGQSWSNTGALGNIWALTTNSVGEVFAGTGQVLFTIVLTMVIVGLI